jgi:MFS family permease
MGMSEAFYIPAALALISDYHTGGTRSRATGLHQMGIYCGVILGGFTGYVADAPALGWRWMFNVTGLVGIIYAPILLMVLRDAPKSNTTSDVDNKPSVITAVHELLTNKSFILLVMYFTLPALAGWVVRDWMPAILQKSFNISQGKAGVSATLYWQAAAIVSAFVGGWLADRWMRRTDRGRIYVSAIGMALIIPALFGVGNAPNLNSLSLAIASLVLFGIGWGFFDGNNMPILSQIVRPNLRATGYGLMNLVSISFGGFADVGFGALRDRNVPLNVIFGAFAAIDQAARSKRNVLSGGGWYYPRCSSRVNAGARFVSPLNLGGLFTEETHGTLSQCHLPLCGFCLHYFYLQPLFRLPARCESRNSSPPICAASPMKTAITKTGLKSITTARARCRSTAGISLMARTI